MRAAHNRGGCAYYAVASPTRTVGTMSTLNIIVIGASGTVGTAVTTLFTDLGHHVTTVGRASGDIRCDITDEDQLADLWTHVDARTAQYGPVDAVVCTAGEVVYAALEDLTAKDFLSSVNSKALAQINVVRTGIAHIAPTGSFTLISGIPSRDPVMSGSAAATANGAVEAFVRAAAIEIAPRRINVVSPSVLTESLEAFGEFFPGYPDVPGAEVARGFRKAVEGAATGQEIDLP